MTTPHSIHNAYISVEVQCGALQALCGCLEKSLASRGVPVIPPQRQAHVSLGYTTGEVELDSMERLVERLSRFALDFRVRDVEILEGLTTPFDYIAVTVEDSRDFRQARAEIECHLPVKSMPGGMKAHISLLRVPKGVLNPQSRRELCACLREQVHAHGLGLSVCGEKLAVFDQQGQCRIQCAIAGVASRAKTSAA